MRAVNSGSSKKKIAWCWALMFVLLLASTGCTTQSSVSSASETSDMETVSTENRQSQQIESADMANTENPESENTDEEIASENGVSTISVSFENEDSGLNLAGVLFLPEGFDETSQYAAIVVTGPMLSVKEQAQSIYAERLAENGFVTLVFDYSYFGESEGEPRQLENPDSWRNRTSRPVTSAVL